MKLFNFKWAILCFILCLFFDNTKTVNAVTSPGGITCKVHSYLVDGNYQLPYKNDRPEIVNGSSSVKPGDYIIYTFEIQNESGIDRIELQKAYMTQVMGINEPLDIIQVRPQNGNCNINSNEKSVFCGLNYSFAESANSPIEYLVKISDKPGDAKTSSMFSLETSGGSTQCVSYLWIKDENKFNAINWSTPYAALKSDNFYIRIGDKKFYGKEPVEIHSDPGTNKTTLEAIWNENGLEMRMFMYFQKTDNGEWEMYELRSYNGEQQGDWIYYKDSLGNRVYSVPGYHNYYDKRIFVPIDGRDAEIFCDKCSINAFLKNDPPITESGYNLEFLIGLPTGKIITITNQPMTGYGVAALLKNNQGEVVKDQNDFNYQWTVDNLEIIYITAGKIDYGNGKCAYDINYPCPQNHVSVSGLKPGKATINLKVSKNSDGVVVAQNSFPVLVTAVTPTSIATKCINRGESIAINKTGTCCSGLTLVRPEGDRTDISGVCMQECSQDSECFIGESCQQQRNSSKFVCSITKQDNQVIDQLKNEVNQLKVEVKNQKVQQNKLLQMIESIKQFLQNLFG